MNQAISGFSEHGADGLDKRHVWTWSSKAFELEATRHGSGPTALLLPSLSSISTRDEMAPLASRLGSRFASIAVDWPGFGTAPKPSVAWSPAALRSYLDFLLEEVAASVELVVAAGHAAAYLVEHAARRPAANRKLVLVAPTWRGPLPTMMGRRPFMARLGRAADVPFMGSALYRINVNPLMVRMMTRAHVYSDPHWLDPNRARRKAAVTNAPGARHAAVRFVTGELDPYHDRADLLAAARSIREPVMVIYGAEAPRKSRAEMEALAALPGIATCVLPRGKLSLHEEYPDDVADAILRFMSNGA